MILAEARNEKQEINRSWRNFSFDWIEFCDCVFYGGKMDEVEIWLVQAERDLETANKNLNIGEFHVGVFYSQQAIEKALKSYLLREKKELLKTHSPVKLARASSVPMNLLKKVEEFEPVYQESRYPDVGVGLPSDRYNAKDCEKFIKIAEEVILWCKKKSK